MCIAAAAGTGSGGHMLQQDVDINSVEYAVQGCAVAALLCYNRAQPAGDCDMGVHIAEA